MHHALNYFDLDKASYQFLCWAVQVYMFVLLVRTILALAGCETWKAYIFPSVNSCKTMLIHKPLYKMHLRLS